MKKSTDSTNLADLLERVLDKGLVVAGDIKIKLVEVELLTIQLRLVVCSVDRARELGMDFWTANPDFLGERSKRDSVVSELEQARTEIDQLRAQVARDHAPALPTPTSASDAEPAIDNQPARLRPIPSS